MSYRDSLDAAMARLANLEQELAEKTASSAATEQELGRLKRELAGARREVRRLQAEIPGSAPHARRPFITALLVGLGLVVATAVAGYHSERFGVMMSYLAAAPVGFGLSGLVGARHSRNRGWLLAAVGAVLLELGLLVFYEGIWPSL
jgi:hypothetical protein